MKGTRTPHEEVVLRYALWTLLNRDLGKEDIEKLGCERLHVHG
jgi:hypothetical protein